jgi:hypothetical protein
MKRRANYNAGKGKGGSYTQDVPEKKRNPLLRPMKKPEQPGDGWAARLVNDPLELLCYAGLCMVICWVITLFR